MAAEMQVPMDLGDAARTLGVHYQTAYRWVRTGVLPAVKVDGEYRLTAEDVESLAELRRSGQAVSYTGRNRDWPGLVQQFYRAAVTGNETGARRVFERLHLSRVPMLVQCEQLVAPFAQRLGAEFLEGTVLAGQVRMAASVCERQLQWATGLVREPGEPTALIVLPPEERHRLPMAMASSVLRAERWAVTEVDGDVDLDDLLAFAPRLDPALVVITPTVTDGAAKDLAAEFARVLPAPILVGGIGAPLQELVDAASVVREVRSRPSWRAPGPPAALAGSSGR